MKICDKCGAYNSDDKMFCVDCSEKLGDAISQREETVIKNKLNNKLEKLSNKSDCFYVSLYDKILSAVSIAGIIFIIVLAFFGKFQEDATVFIISAVCFVSSAFESLFPKLAWQVEIFFLSFKTRDWENAEPSEYYILRRKILPTVTTALGFLLSILTVFI